MKDSKRALGLAWGIAFLGLIYAELNPPPTLNALSSLLDATTEDGPAACFGFLTGATIMHLLNSATNEDDIDDLRYDVLVLAGFCMVSGILLSTIQVAIAPITATVGIVALCILPLARLNDIVLLLALVGMIVVAAFVHTSFFVEFPFGGPYPLLAWIAYGIGGILVYRVLTQQRVYVYILFWMGVFVGFLGFLTVLPNYMPSLFGISSDMGAYYRYNPPSPSLRMLSSEAHSGGLLNTIGNLSVGCYLFSACFILQRFRVFTPVIAVGRTVFSTYPFYLVAAAIAMGGFPGFSYELDSAITSPSATLEQRTLDWPTFSSWVSNSSSWEELALHEGQYYGNDGQPLINTAKAQGAELRSVWWSWPFVAILTLTMSTLWLRRFNDGLLEMLLLRHRKRQ